MIACPICLTKVKVVGWKSHVRLAVHPSTGVAFLQCPGSGREIDLASGAPTKAQDALAGP